MTIANNIIDGICGALSIFRRKINISIINYWKNGQITTTIIITLLLNNIYDDISFNPNIFSLLFKVDGVELNVTAGSKERLYHFVKGLKDEMVRKSIDKRILMSLPTKPEDLAKQFDLKKLSK